MDRLAGAVVLAMVYGVAAGPSAASLGLSALAWLCICLTILCISS